MPTPTVTLSAKIYNESQLKLVEDNLKTALKSLNLKIEKVQATPQNWIQITFSGEDERAALNYLENTIGICPANVNSIAKFQTVKGYLIDIGKSEDQLCLDIGLTTQNIVAKISLRHLQAQLVDGRKVALRKIVELYGFCENMPITAKIIGVNGSCLEAIIAEIQLNQYKRWVKSLLDKLIVLGASQHEITKALRGTRCQNDVVGIEQLGLFEYVVTCKLGTDAVGLIPKIGKRLPNAVLTVFSPRKILEFLPHVIYH
jgi:hypothetical protein